MEGFLLVFIPLFVAIDALGTFPLFLSMTEGQSGRQRQRLALEAVTTALIIGVGFGLLGNYVFAVLGITSADFRIAGGLLLLILSIKEIFGDSAKKSEGRAANKFIGAVPLGVPIIAGPAMITTLLILFDSFPFMRVMMALVLNLMITLIVFLSADTIEKKLGDAASQALAKVIGIFLAAIGIMMIRKGVMAIFSR